MKTKTKRPVWVIRHKRYRPPTYECYVCVGPKKFALGWTPKADATEFASLKKARAVRASFRMPSDWVICRRAPVAKGVMA